MIFIYGVNVENMEEKRKFIFSMVDFEYLFEFITPDLVVTFLVEIVFERSLEDYVNNIGNII